MPKVLIGLPTYNNQIDARLSLFLFNARTDNIQTLVKTKQLSALCWSFNHFWADALNDKTFDYFLLIHADIVPIAPQRWITKLIGEAERTHADLISVVSPLKNTDGLTSTALISNTHAVERRLSMTEVHKLPETFGADEVAKLYGWQDDENKRLLINTGCMLADLRRNRAIWETMWFKTIDRVVKRDGKFVATFVPEDWDFSEQAHANGLQVRATRAIELIHHGASDYYNNKVFGTKESDL